MVIADDLEWSEQIGQAAWIAPRLSAFDSGLAGSVIPRGARGGGSEVPLSTGHMDRLQETAYSSLLHSVLSMVNN